MSSIHFAKPSLLSVNYQSVRNAIFMASFGQQITSCLFKCIQVTTESVGGSLDSIAWLRIRLHPIATAYFSECTTEGFR